MKLCLPDKDQTSEKELQRQVGYVSYTVSLKTAEFVLMLAIMSISRKVTCTYDISSGAVFHHLTLFQFCTLKAVNLHVL